MSPLTHPRRLAQDGWTESRHRAFATNDVPARSVTAVADWVHAALRARVLGALEARHATGPLSFRDLFFVRYSHTAAASGVRGAQKGLEAHRDGSPISFNVLLNSADDFDGGGTFFEEDRDDDAPDAQTALPRRTVRRIARGDCLVHSGKQRHGGVPVTRGERFLLVGFIDGDLRPDDDDEPERGGASIGGCTALS